MLHQDPLMTEMDVNHWRNLQSLVLESARAKRRIVVIHEAGRVLKLIHSNGDEVAGRIDRIDDPHAAAAALYRANEDRVDFVAVYERRAFDSYFAAFQDTWRADEDLDVYVHRTYAMLDDYPDGMVTFPGPARATLGLQWRVGATYAQVVSAVDKFAKPNSTVVLGVFDGDGLWASLVLGFDGDRRANIVTTVDPMVMALTGDRAKVVRTVLDWVATKFPAQPCRLALFTDTAGARAVLKAADKLTALRDLKAEGRLIASPAPPELSALLS